jgi:hypothetical protein
VEGPCVYGSAENPVKAGLIDSPEKIEAAYLMLDMQAEREGWKGSDYAAALRERFSL